MEPNTIEIICKNNGKRIQVPAGTTLNQLAEQLQITLSTPIIAALVNNTPYPLAGPIYHNRTVEFFGCDTPEGQRIYLRSVTMLLYTSLTQCYPGYRLQVEHSLGGGYLLRIKQGDVSLTPEQLPQLVQRARQLVQADLPFVPHYIPRQEAIAMLEQDGDTNAALLIRNQKDYYTLFYELDGVYDYYLGILASRTGDVGVFTVEPYADGFLLRIADAKNPTVVSDKRNADKVYGAFNEQLKWSSIVGIHDITDIEKANDKQLDALIKVTEALHEKKIAHIAEEIVSRGQVKVVLIAGPSSSGKTTFSKRLSIQLAASGVMPRVLSLDDYFVDRDKTPLDENGQTDFESLYALDLPLFHQQLADLIAGKEVEMPTYNFETGQREYRTGKTKLKPTEILVIEGIHGLNPELTATIAPENKFLIYASALTTLSINDHNRIPTTDTRLLRRIIRDAKYRAYPAEKTILRWPSVRRGEEKWIFPFQENADAIFNTSLITETYAVKPQAVTALSQVPEDSDAYPEAKRLLSMLQFFRPIPERFIPPTSLIREFVGGSGFHY